MFYLIVWQESDGNDCTVYDSIVEETSEDAALSTLADAIEETLTANETGFQEDGNHLGYYFDCDCPEEYQDHCDGHGGISLRTVESYTAIKDANGARSKWHTLYEVPR